MDQNISFNTTMLNGLYKVHDAAHWTRAQKLFEQQKPLESFYALLDYLDPQLCERYGNADRTEFTIPHGSTVVIIKLHDGQLTIRAPFVYIPETKNLPIFRKCTELNFTVLTVPQIVLEDDLLVFTCSMPIALCEPYKLYDLLRDICINADKYDDEFVTRFHARRVLEPMVTNYSDEILAQIIQTCQSIATETLTYIKHFEAKRKLSQACDALFIGMKRIEYYCAPTAMLGNKLEEAFAAMFNRDNDMLGKLKPGKALLESFATMTTDELRESCYVTFNLIPVRKNANRKTLEEWIEDDYEGTTESFNQDDFLGAAFRTQFALYRVLADFNIEDSIRNPIEKGLKAAAGKPWEEAAATLMLVLDWLYQNNGEDLDIDSDEEENDAVANAMAGFDMNAYMEQMSGFMGNFQNMLGGLLKGVGKNK